MNSLRYFVYLRKSSESEDRQELSIEGQRHELDDMVKRMGLTVIGPPQEEAKSAKRPGRPVFTKMLDDIRAKKADGIVCWKLNRLARNPKDGGTIMYELGEGIIKEIVIPGRTYRGTGSDKLLMSIEFGMATRFSDDLSEDVRRGNRDTLRAGRWPGCPKLGYARDYQSGQLIPDPERFNKTKELWQLVLRGVSPLDVLRVARQDMNLTTPRRGKNGGGLLTRSHLYRMLHDDFYTGLMRRAGEVHEGSHQPIVTVAEFSQVQELIRRNTRLSTRTQRLFFPYRGMILCGSCSAVVTAQNAINRYGTQYVYYHCCRKQKRYIHCPERSIEEHALEAQLRTFIGSLMPPKAWCDEALKRTTAMIEDAARIREDEQKHAEIRLTKIDQRLERLRALCADEVITPEEYGNDRSVLLQEKQCILSSISTKQEPNELIKLFADSVSFLNQALFAFEHAKSEEKRELVRTLTSNLVLKDKNLLIKAKEPFATYGKWRESPTMCTWLNDVKTLFLSPQGTFSARIIPDASSFENTAVISENMHENRPKSQTA